METSSQKNNTIPKNKQARKPRGRRNQVNPAPSSTNNTTVTPIKILSRNEKKLNNVQPTAMAISPQVNQVVTLEQHEYTLTEALDDVLIRFILNCPEEEHESMDRLFFQIEEAHWFYEDFYRENCKSLPELKFKEFVEKIFAHCPLLTPYRSKVDAHTQSFYQYKTSVPVCGSIILNETLDKVLLVKGWSNKSSWSFPRGKINRDEPELQCAIREVFEETGFDISQHGANDKDFVEMVMGEQKIKLFIVTGVSEDTVFIPQTRKEISATEWHTFEKILERSPTTQKTSGKYWPVIPFVRKVKKWIAENKKRLLNSRKKKANINKRNKKSNNVNTNEDMMSVSPPRSTNVTRQIHFEQPNIMPQPYYAQPHHYNTDPYAYSAYQQYNNHQYQHYYPNNNNNMTTTTSTINNSADSFLSFSFNMNEIFEDSAVQNVVA